MGKEMEWVVWSMILEPNTLANSRKAKDMDMVANNGQVDRSMKDTGKMVRDMANGLRGMKMVNSNGKQPIKMTFQMAN